MTQTRTLDTTPTTIRSDFAGAGGMVQGIRQAGFTGRIVACEFNPAAVKTGRAAGHEYIEGDVRSVPFGSLGSLLGYTAGPPCQTFTSAGKGEGRKALDVFIAAAEHVVAGLTPAEAVAAVAGPDHGLDERSVLVLHPLHVILNERPVFVVLEQVKQVRPIWDVYRTILEAHGYAVDVRVWSAEEYGAPQTRQRASLVALRRDYVEGEIDLHAPATHSRYYPRDKARRDPGVPSFVTIAEALGRQEKIRSNYGTGGDPAARGERHPDEPAATVTSKVGRNKWAFAGAGQTAQQTSRQQPRPVDEAPAHTVTGSRSAAWVPDGLRPLDDDETLLFGDVVQERGTTRLVDEPAPTITGALDNGNYRWQPVVEIPGDTSWVDTRPSPTIVGSFRPDVVAAPGYRKAGDPPRQKTPGSIRVTIREAAALQTFPDDYPWQGSVSEQYQQIGNAVPPLVASKVVGHLLDLVKAGA
jgi:DNA (cytosine-5)-methyltransferase 1